MASGTKTKKILLVSTDRAFVQDTRTAFTASEVIELLTVEKSINELRGEILEADFGTVIVDMDAAKLEEIESLQRVMRRLEGRIPVVVVTQEFNAAAVRILVQLKVADFLVKPITTADLVRSAIRALHLDIDRLRRLAAVDRVGERVAALEARGAGADRHHALRTQLRSEHDRERHRAQGQDHAGVPIQQPVRHPEQIRDVGSAWLHRATSAPRG